MDDPRLKKIPLTQGKYALVDTEDFEWLSQYKWYFDGRYARRSDVSKPGHPAIMMHRLINNTPDGFETDHINRDKLDNRRANLRTATRAENKYNTPLRADNASGIKGVSWYRHTKKWTADVWVNRKQLRLGYFERFDDAVKARRDAEVLYGCR